MGDGTTARRGPLGDSLIPRHPAGPKLWRREEEDGLILIEKARGWVCRVVAHPRTALVRRTSQSPRHPVTCQIKARVICLVAVVPQQFPQGKRLVSKRILCPPLLRICGRDASGELKLPRFAWEALNENLCHFLVAVLCWGDYPRGLRSLYLGKQQSRVGKKGGGNS